MENSEGDKGAIRGKLEVVNVDISRTFSGMSIRKIGACMGLEIVSCPFLYKMYGITRVAGDWAIDGTDTPHIQSHTWD